MPAPVRLRPAELIVSFMEVTYANVSVRSDGKRSVKSLVTFFPSKEYFDLPKVYSSLSKVRVPDELLTLPLRGRGTSLCGTSSIRRDPTASHHQE